MSLIKFVKENHPLMPKFTQWVFWAVGECKVCIKYSGILVLMPFKGTVSRDGYFFEGLNILQELYTLVLILSDVSSSFLVFYVFNKKKLKPTNSIYRQALWGWRS
jgi:hypothetical protein